MRILKIRCKAWVNYSQQGDLNKYSKNFMKGFIRKEIATEYSQKKIIFPDGNISFLLLLNEKYSALLRILEALRNYSGSKGQLACFKSAASYSEMETKRKNFYHKMYKVVKN